jgi:hypothetical protein
MLGGIVFMGLLVIIYLSHGVDDCTFFYLVGAIMMNVRPQETRIWNLYSLSIIWFTTNIAGCHVLLRTLLIQKRSQKYISTIARLGFYMEVMIRRPWQHAIFLNRVLPNILNCVNLLDFQLGSSSIRIPFVTVVILINCYTFSERSLVFRLRPS